MIYKKTTLKNGLRIITVPMKEAEAVTVMVLVSGFCSRVSSLMAFGWDGGLRSFCADESDTI